ncbi:MAG: alpha-galactosidase [Ahrensia sp.]|nr:alpha-galactosidase [Ahrensia sp.]
MLKTSKRGEDINVAAWRLDTLTRTAVFASFDGGVPALVHFGAKLPLSENLVTLAKLSVPNVSGGQLDPMVPLTLMPTAMDGWQGHPGIIMTDKYSVEVLPSWNACSADVHSQNKMQWTLQSSDLMPACALTFAANLADHGILSVQVEFENYGDLRLQWLCNGAIPIPEYMPRIIDHGGRWTGEFQRQERLFTVGMHVRESREGRTGHANFPGMIFASDACDENTGECMGITLPWSGGHKIIAEEIPDGRRQVQVGFDANTMSCKREVKIAWSGNGLNGLSNTMYSVPREFSRGKLATRNVKRPVHYNCWEAVYFRHSVEELKQIASLAASVGAERFVLDDGWFKGRNDATTSLGDWTVDATKYPQGLMPLIDHIHQCGMQFGIWFEPEMVNIDSDLYRAHPDWVLGPQNQPSGRGQFVLDLSKSEVTDYLFKCIASILQKYPANYIKWDHNRILSGHAPQQTPALYALIDRLNAAFPNVEIESCSSGGGRIDYGILERTTRVWLSDSNDALERLRIQHEASRWIPPEIQGSHVGPRTCHSSGRIIPMPFRAWVAASRHMGMEMDPRELTPQETTQLKAVIDWYKQNRNQMFASKLLRLDTNDAEVLAEMFVTEDQSRFILFRGQMGASAQIAARPLKLTGLKADCMYEIKMVNPNDVVYTVNQNRMVEMNGMMPLCLSGAALMSGALQTSNAFPLTMHVFEGVAL